MFSSSVGRVVRPSCSTVTTTTTPASTARVAAHTVRGHQRRPSSSKTSVPPDGSKRVAPTGQQAQKAAGSTTRKSRAKNGRSSASARKDAKETFVPLSRLYPEMPEPVKATQHLRREDISLMQLFAGHRPISVNHVLPATTSDAQFDAIFQSKNTWQKYTDTVSQISGAIEGLENASAEEVEDSVHIVHLDPADSVADPISHFYRMNRPPPPPRPAEDFLKENEDKNVRAPRKVRPSPRKGKSWQTTITVTEYTDGQGHRTFRADSTPIVRVPQVESRVVEEPQPALKGSIQQPFLERMRLRQQRWRATHGSKIRSPVKKPRMLLISVKRQRKAKMKKHKLKKLRKRTRNLRRKLGKL